MEQFKSQEVSLDEGTQEFLVRLTEDLHVKIKDGFFLGLSFGMGFGLGMLIWALAFLYVARMLLLSSL